MRFVKICSSEGSLGKNVGCELAPFKIIGSKGIFVKGSLIERNKKLEKSKGDFFVGGDHSITYPLFKGFKGKKKALVIFDAHVDCADYIKPPSHEDWLRVLIQDKVVKSEDVFIIGVRRIYSVERNFLKDKRVNIYRWKDSVSDLSEKLKKYDSIYLSVDIDVLNPKIAPGTGYLHKGGFSFAELKKLLLVVKKTGKIKRVDLVEVNPLKDVKGKTIKLAKKIVRLLK